MLAKLIQILCLFNVFLLLTEQYCGNNCGSNKKNKKTMMIQLLNNEDGTEKKKKRCIKNTM